MNSSAKAWVLRASTWNELRCGLRLPAQSESVRRPVNLDIWPTRVLKSLAR
jgi:hypothetical protein